MSYVRKMGASALVVAAAFAVAFAVLISSSTPAEAGDPDDAAHFHEGERILVQAAVPAPDGDNPEYRTVTIRLTSADNALKGVFAHSRTSQLVCKADTAAATPTGETAIAAVESPCDVGTTTDNFVTVEFIVGAGSTNGHDVVAADFTATTPDSDDDGTAQDAAITFGADGTATPSVFDHRHEVDGNAGDTVTVTFDLSVAGEHNVATQPDPNANGAGDGDFYRIASSSVGSGTFAANGQSSVDCADSTTGTGCDTDKDENKVGLRIAIAADSAKGKIIVERYQRVRGGDPFFRDAIEVNVVAVAAPVATLTLKAAHQSIAAAGGEAGTTTLTVTMLKGDGNPASGQSVTLITTRGNFGNGEQLQKVTTNANGVATATFRGAQVGGEATITATSGDLTKQVTITLHSGPDAIAVAVDDSTIQAEGDNTFIVVTVTDEDGNAVGAQRPTVASVKGPNDLATRVTYDLNVDKNPAGTANDIPACGDDTSADAITDAAAGTNKDGKCVISVSAPKGATAGAHTVNVKLARLPKADLKAAPTVQVVGKPKSLTIAAPDSVDPRGEADITISVYDEAGNVAAPNQVTVRRIEGDGLIEPEAKKTKNGVAAFKFFAPTSGAVVISASVGSGADLVREFHTITVGEEEAPPPPPPPHVPALDRTPASSGYTLVVFNGGSVAELEAVLADVCGASAEAYATNLGSYVSYLVGAPSIVNRAFNDLFADGIPAGEPLLVGNCGS